MSLIGENEEEVGCCRFQAGDMLVNGNMVAEASLRWIGERRFLVLRNVWQESLLYGRYCNASNVVWI